MSQYRRQYQQAPPQGYQGQHDPYSQYSQQQQDQNGYGQQYPGRPTYDQGQGSGSGSQVYGGQQEQYSGAYPGQQSYQYNPQHYAQSQLGPSQQYGHQQYNPQQYASPPTQHQYAPTAFPEAPVHSTSGPLDPYAYSPGNASTSNFAHQSYPQSSQMQGFSPQQSYVSQASGHHYGYQHPQSPPNLQHDYRYAQPTSPPAHNSSYPSENSQLQPSDLSQRQQSQHYRASPVAADEWRPSPPSYQVEAQRQASALYPTSPHSSMPSPPSTTPGPTPPTHRASRSGTVDRHPQSRPLPGPPESDIGQDYFQSHSREDAEALSQEDLFQQVENAVNFAGSNGRGTHSPSISVSHVPYQSNQSSSLLHSPSLHNAREGGRANGHLSPVAAEQRLSDDSDVEGTQGLAMMHAAEEEETWRQSASSQMRFGGGYGSQRGSRQQQPNMPDASDSDDMRAVDVGTLGGYDMPPLTYGGDPNQLVAASSVNGYDPYGQPVSSQHSSLRRSHASQSSQMSRTSAYDYTMDSIHPFPMFNNNARVNVGGTGGLAEPSADGRRQSYDEGDEYTLMEGQVPDRFPEEPLDIFYRPASTSYRPLPVPPEGANTHLNTDSKYLPGQAGYQNAQDGYSGVPHAQNVPRSTSLVSHTTTPQVQQPLRSKTDAEERRLRQQQIRQSAYSTYETTPASATPGVPMDLPTLPGKRFVPSQLGGPAFKKCEEPWSLMSILKWLLTVTNPEQVTEIKEAEVKEALVALFTNKVPTMNITDAEGLSNKVVHDMYAAGTLVTTEEWVRIVPGPMQGVIFQLTGSGCYAPTLHDHIVPGRCYSRLCQRTLKKVNLQVQPTRTSDNWAEFYKVTKEDIEGRDKKELERQNILHEIVSTEDVYMEQLNVLRTLYRDTLANGQPPIVTPRRKDKFIHDVFGKLDAVKQANEDHLLPQLKYRQQEQGPWVVGFSDIFRQWIRKAKAAYIDYAGGFPGATFMVRQEIDRNIEFRNFVDRVRNDKRSNKLGWDTFLKSPITRLQRYTLLLQTVLKTMKTESEEKNNLKIAYDEVKVVTLECDARVAEMQRKVDLSDLGMKLVLRPGMQSAVELNLDHFGRELIHRGDLQRMGSNRFTWLDCHALLFDHYLVLSKAVVQRSDQGGKTEKYDISRLPIPMDLLILESSSEPPVQKSTYVKGLTSVRDVAGRAATPLEPATLGKTTSNQTGGSGTLHHTNTSSSSNSLQPVTSLGENKDADRIMYPFKVKHLGRDIYTLFAPSEQTRREWCTKIIEAKTKHAASLHNQNAEPFKLRVMADSAFVYDAFALTGSKSVVIKGSPVDRAIAEVEKRFKDAGRPAPVCRARVNCATTFTPAYPGSQMVAVGTDFGVYVSALDNPRGWTRVIQMPRVAQVAVLEEFNLFLLISDKSLIAYHLDAVYSANQNGVQPTADSTRKAPQKLSGSKDVGFFVTGKMKDRTLVFYKKRENLASVFKVLEPIYQKSTEKKRGMFKRGNTEFFRDYDEFYIPAECNGINVFHSSLAVSTARGFEVLTLDKKQPWSVPDLRAPHVQNIATHIKDQKALAMLRLSDQEFLLVYANCAVYVNKHGDVSRSVIMEFVGEAQSAALHGAYLILFDNDFVEIRNAQNGRLKQIIAGREIKCLDDGGSWSSATTGADAHGAAANGSTPLSRTVKLVMQHPEMDKTQIVVELVLNENMKE